MAKVKAGASLVGGGQSGMQANGEHGPGDNDEELEELAASSPPPGSPNAFKAPHGPPTPSGKESQQMGLNTAHSAGGAQESTSADPAPVTTADPITTTATRTSARIKPAANAKQPAQKGRAKRQYEEVSEDEDEDESEDDDYSEDEKPTKTKGVKPKGKILYAEQAYWKDLPKWGNRTDCPLLELPAEILDRCFSLDKGLNIRDYLALAGTCKLFRSALTNEAWLEITFHLNTYIPPMKTPTTRHMDHLLTHEVQDWTVTVPKIEAKKKNSTISPTERHYLPKGPRSQWTRHQYIVYKEEKARCREKDRKAKKVAAEAKKAFWNGMGKIAKHEREFIEAGSGLRTLLAVVQGRKDGEAALVKDDKGIPLVDQPVRARLMTKRARDNENEIMKREESRSIKASGSRLWQLSRMKAGGAEKEKAKEERKRRVQAILNSEDSEKETRPAKKGKSGSRKKKWIIPDTESEYETEEEVPSDKAKVHDFWPSRARSEAVAHVERARINKTEALKVFKVKEAELLTLTHWLTPNPFNSKR
ncbi:hypothetical protein P7C73_g3126, partial [Tremellales sp. Uapishka_1]